MESPPEQNILEQFRSISAHLSKKELPITVSSIAKEFNLSPLEAKALLNDFIVNDKSALEKYIVAFSIEQQQERGIAVFILLSTDCKLKKVLKSGKTRSFSVFAIMKKTKEFTLDYGSLLMENNVEDRYDLSSFQVEKPISIKKSEEKPVNKGVQQPLVQQFNSKLVVVDENEEELYQGFKPKKPNTDLKRKVNESTAVSSLPKPTKKNKGRGSRSNSNSHSQSNLCFSSDKEEKSSPSKEDKKHSFETEKDKDKEEPEQDANSTDIPRKVLKKRKIKKTIQRMNEKGYLITEDDWTEEEYWEEERPSFKSKQIQKQPQPAQLNKKNKKMPNDQSSLFSFLKKP